MSPASPRLVADRPSLLAVVPLPLIPVRSRYALRASCLLQELANSWSITLLAPAPSEVVDDLIALGIKRVVSIPALADWDSWTIEADGIRRIVDSVIDAMEPQAAILWAGAEPIAVGGGLPIPTVIDRLDSEVLIILRALRWTRGFKDRLRQIRDALVLAGRERRIGRTRAMLVVSTDADARMLRAVSRSGDVHVVRSGVSIGPDPVAADEAPIPTVIFSGSMHAGSETNVLAVRWFVDAVWSSVRQAVPNARFLIAGRSPAREILSFQSIPGIEVVADVADMPAVLRQAWVAVAPLQTGSGIPTKVLEAWAVGRPVVLSPIAASGLSLDHHAASLVARDAVAMARSIECLLTNRAERERLGRAAHALAARKYNGWKTAGAMVSELLRAGIADFEARGGKRRSTVAPRPHAQRSEASTFHN